MKLNDLYNGIQVTCRTGRSGRTGVEWEKDQDGTTWHPETLHIQKDPKGQITLITLKDRPWAEASLKDMRPGPEGAMFIVEDWYLQIMNLEI